MKHKLVSMITALMMLSAVALITGCNTPQGNKGSTPVSKTDLQGVWKVTAQGQYAMHILVEGTTIYAATNAAGSFVKVPSPFTYNSDGTISISGQKFTPVKNGDKIDLQLSGVTGYTLKKDASVTSDTIKNASTIPGGNGNKQGNNGNNQGNNGNNQGNNGNNQGNNGNNQGNNGNNQGNNGNNQGNNGGNQGNNGNNQGNNGGNQASQQDLQGVWKVTAQGQYAVHIFVEGTTVYAAMEVPSMPGSFVKVPSPFTYNSDGTISVSGQKFTPVKNGEAIDLQYSGYSAYTMTKDASVTSDTIKNAPEMQQP